jgi:hypothetical protein
MRNETMNKIGAWGMIREERGVAYFRVLFSMQKKLRENLGRICSLETDKQTKGERERKKK